MVGGGGGPKTWPCTIFWITFWAARPFPFWCKVLARPGPDKQIDLEISGERGKWTKAAGRVVRQWMEYLATGLLRPIVSVGYKVLWRSLGDEKWTLYSKKTFQKHRFWPIVFFWNLPRPFPPTSPLLLSALLLSAAISGASIVAGCCWGLPCTTLYYLNLTTSELKFHETWTSVDTSSPKPKKRKHGKNVHGIKSKGRTFLESAPVACKAGHAVFCLSFFVYPMICWKGLHLTHLIISLGITGVFKQSCYTCS